MKPVLIFLLNITCILCLAQPIVQNSSNINSIQINLGHNQIKEANLHPKVFRGLNIGASYSHTKERKHISEITTGLELLLLNTIYEPFPSAAGIEISSAYKHLFTLLKNDEISFYIGSISDLKLGTNSYFNWDESHLYYANYISQGISNRISYFTNKNQFDFNIDLPVISIISRPTLNRQFKIDDMTFLGVIKNLTSNPQLAFPNQNFYIKTGVEFFFSQNRIKNRSIAYNFKYQRVCANEGKPYQTIKQTITYKFLF